MIRGVVLEHQRPAPEGGPVSAAGPLLLHRQDPLGVRRHGVLTARGLRRVLFRSHTEQDRVDAIDGVIDGTADAGPWPGRLVDNSLTLKVVLYRGATVAATPRGDRGLVIIHTGDENQLVSDFAQPARDDANIVHAK